MDRKSVAASMRVTRSSGTWIVLLSLLVLAGSCRAPKYSSTEPVGQVGPQRYVTPVHQVLTPVGIQVELPGMRPQGLALSPDGRLLATSGKTQELVLIDPQSGEIKQRVALPSSKAQGPERRVLPHPRARQVRPAQLHRPDLQPGRVAHLPVQRQWRRQGVRRQSGRAGQAACSPSPCPRPMLRVASRRFRPAWRFPAMGVGCTWP